MGSTEWSARPERTMLQIRYGVGSQSPFGPFWDPSRSPYWTLYPKGLGQRVWGRVPLMGGTPHDAIRDNTLCDPIYAPLLGAPLEPHIV